MKKVIPPSQDTHLARIEGYFLDIMNLFVIEIIRRIKILLAKLTLTIEFT
jgi:hypothetical protein